jgi:ketosteroid isomerase-like protein
LVSKPTLVRGHLPLKSSKDNSHQAFKSNGRAFTIPFALHLTVTEGRITRYHVYEDSPTVAEALAA